MQPTSVFLPGEFLAQRSLAGYSPRGHKESDATERLNTHSTLYNQLEFVGKSPVFHTPCIR